MRIFTSKSKNETLRLPGEENGDRFKILQITPTHLSSLIVIINDLECSYPISIEFIFFENDNGNNIQIGTCFIKRFSNNILDYKFSRQMEFVVANNFVCGKIKISIGFHIDAFLNGNVIVGCQ